MLVPILRFKNFDKNWDTKFFGEIFKFLPTNSFPRSKLNNERGKVYNIHYGDIHKNFSTLLDFDNANDVPFINENVNLSKIREDSYCQDGDLIIADASEDYEDIGKAIELKNVKDKKILSGLHTFLVRDHSNLTVPGYRCYIFLNNKVKIQIKKFATGISVLGISKNNISKIKINLPNSQEQEKIAIFLSKVDEKIRLFRRLYLIF